jgi:hypothetical protein
MSDLVVVEQQGATVIVQEVPTANLIEVVAAGPQGAQGDKGDKGDIGDVTPAALAAKTAAEVAATSANSSAIAASTSAGQAAAAASTATTKASEASASASGAASSATAASGSATSAATSASTATTKASEASASATTASTSASNAATSAGTATTKAAEASTSAASAASSALAATTQATQASTSATNAANSAASAATSATSASGSASTATTKAGEAAGSATSAAASASTATTKATEASGSAITASTAATTATTQAGIATTKAGEAATSATNAAASAATATTQASNASSSATSAAAAKAAAESARDQTLAAFDSFDDRYLGAKAADPTLDNDGNALVGGALYFNTAPLASGGGMKVYDAVGAVWLAAYASLSGALVAANNLSDLASASAARTNLGLGNVENKSSATIRGELTSGNVTGALGFTPYDAANPAGYVDSSALSAYLLSATAASTYQPIGAYLTGITSSQVTTALGFTPYNAANPSGYITSAALSSYLLSSTAASTYLPLSGGTTTGAITFNIGGSIAAKIGVSGLVSIGGEAGSADSLFTVTNGGGIGLEFSPTAITGRNRILSYNRSATDFVPLNYAASEHNWDVSGTVRMSLTSSALNIAGTGQLITGDLSNATASLRLAFQTSIPNNSTVVTAKPNGTGTNSFYILHNSSDADNSSYLYLGITDSVSTLTSNYNGTGAALPLSFVVGSERGRISATSGNWMIGTSTDNGVDKLQVNGGVSFGGSITEAVYSVSGTTPALSPTNGSIQTWTLSGASTPTAGTWASGQSITLMVDDGSSFAITWTSLAVTWETGGGTAPTLAPTGYTVISLWKVGTTIYGATLP